jgi:uroporphyrinogen decarboxylase
VIGGFGQTEQDLIYRGNEEEIRKETERILTDTGTTGVVLGADCTIPRDTDIRHLEWIRRAAEEFVK